MTGEEFLYLQKTNGHKEPEIVPLNNSTKKRLRIAGMHAFWVQYSHNQPHQAKWKNR
jgi:hypothetical protein